VIEPRTVPAAHGLQWAREGLEAFAAAPLVWVGVTILFLLLGVAISVIPFAGMLWSVAAVIHAGGLMLGCEALRQGRSLEVRHLFAGFEQPRLQPLALLGALYLAGTIVIMIPVALIVFGSMVTSAVAVGTNPTGSGIAAASIVVALGVLVMAAGVVALSMALWFAPALVVFHDVAPLDALKLSLLASSRNVPAFVTYFLVSIGLGIVAISPLAAAILLVAVGGQQHAGPFAVVLIGGTGLFTLLCMLLFMPAAWGAMHASYRDVFATPDPASVAVV
jgi:membrane-anchored glycerophosphoryl diester phosphodiesterase (GDPDase)